MQTEHNHWMILALQQARQAEAAGEVPVGAVLVSEEGLLLAKGFNQVIASHDPSAHAEIVALREGAKSVGNYRLPGSRLYVTIEPCAMCLGALVHARVWKVVYGAREPKAGCVHSHPELLQSGQFNHHPKVVGGVLAEDCAALMQRFFASRR